MKPGEKLWKAFVDVGKVLKDDDLENFGRALFFGTSFKNLGSGAKRTIQAMAVKIPTSTPAQIYVAIASQSWGLGDLKQIATAVTDHWLFRQLSDGNRARIDRAAAEIDWPSAQPPVRVEPLHPPASEKPRPDLRLVDPFEDDEKVEQKSSKALAVGSALVLLLLVGVML